MELERDLEDLRPGDHLAHFYGEADEQMAVLVPFLKAGLVRGERCLYVTAMAVADRIGKLLAGSLGVRPHPARGPLILMTGVEWPPPGEFNPSRMARSVAGMVQDAVGAGFGGLRVAAEMAWASDNGVTSERLKEWELALHTVFAPGCQLLAVCQYNLRRFPSGVLRRQLYTHPKVILGGHVCSNFFFDLPDGTLSRRSEATRFRGMVDLLERARAAEDARAQAQQERAARAAAETAGRLAAFLSQASTLLASSLDMESTLKRVAHLPVPGMADWCLIDLLDEGGAAQRVAIAHKDPARVRWASLLLRRHRADAGGFHLVEEVLRRGECRLLPRVSEELLAGLGRDAEHLALLRDLGLESAMVVPLRGHGRVLGAMTFATAGSGRHYGPEDLVVAEEFAWRAALALENARLYEESQRRRREAEMLAGLGRLLSQSLDISEVGRPIVDGVRELLRVRVAILYLTDSATGAMTPIASAGDVGPAAGGTLMLPPGTGLVGLAAAQRQPVESKNILTDPRVVLSPEVRDRIERAPVRSGLVIPLIVRDRVLGGLLAADAPGRGFGSNEVRLLQALGDQATIALENARLFGQAKEVAAQRERVRLARDLHDTLSQMAFSLGLKLNRCLASAPEGSEIRLNLEEIERDAGLLMGQVRQIISYLGADGPPPEAFSQAMQRLVDEFRELTGLAVEYCPAGDVGRIGRAQREAIHKSVREALVNVAKHAQAGRVRVRLAVQGTEVEFEVADDGMGAAAKGGEEVGGGEGGHFGLRHMRERIEGLGGRLESGRSVPSGFWVRGVLPQA